MQQKKHLFTLNAGERLKHRKKIDALFASGQKLSLGDIRLVYHSTPSIDKGMLLIGVGVSKRYFKKAVDRNQIKRWLREAVRLNRLELLLAVESSGRNLDLFILYTGKMLPDFAHCQQLVQAAFQRLMKKL
jgi:ribonuclease P protein component